MISKMVLRADLGRGEACSMRLVCASLFSFTRLTEVVEMVSRVCGTEGGGVRHGVWVLAVGQSRGGSCEEQANRVGSAGSMREWQPCQ